MNIIVTRMIYLPYLLLSYIYFLNCQADEEGEVDAGEEEEAEAPNKDDKNYGKTVVCDNICMKNSGYIGDKEICGKQEETPINPQVECITKADAGAGGEEEGEEEEEEGAEGEEEEEGAEAELKPKKKK